MSEVKQVKVDNWGVYFLQRLKHFFNRTDYCDLTLQFQDNAQLKVHRLVLSACTEYFELLERTCEMYEDCLVMPDDLQADVVVPIVNFMYTGQLEFRMDLLERLYQTSQIMNLPVLTKLLESHRQSTPKPTHCYTGKRKSSDSTRLSTPSTSYKRSYSKAFENNHTYKDKKVYQSTSKEKEETFATPTPIQEAKKPFKKVVSGEPRPTRYELPEELDTDNVFDSSFCNISYTSKPLMVHPETVKRYSSRRSTLFGEPSSSKKFIGASTLDIVECKKIGNDLIFEDTAPDHNSIDEAEMFPSSFVNVKNQTTKDTNQLFDQMLDQNETPKITIDTKNSKIAANLDHAKIISEVLKKYSHLLKGNKNIKLKILNTPNTKKKQKPQAPAIDEKPIPIKKEELDATYESNVIDSQQAAKLIAMGAENIKGPWICLICGTPGRALHFPTYYKFRRHLVEVHNEKPVVNICEHCGHRALKRNYLLHHLFSKHGIAPPPQYNFPKCNQCNYIALTEGFLVKHKMTHNTDPGFRCNVCASIFLTSHQLLQHIQSTGHKYSADRKNNLQCVYCLKVFLRENNLFAHLKTHHKREAKSDGIIEDSDEEKPRVRSDGKIDVKYEPPSADNDYEEVDVQYQIQADGNIHVISNKKSKTATSKAKQTILNPEFGTSKSTRKTKAEQNTQPQHVHNEFLEEINVSSANNNDGEFVTIDNNEYVIRDNQFFSRKMKPVVNEEYVISDIMENDTHQTIQAVTPTTSADFRHTHGGNFVDNNMQQASMIINKPNVNQSIRLVVSNEEEYKALISANHPIIFDNGDTNKTLTVLTAPHTATLESATIDLDNTQPNDMMIIQEDFPLNVSEALATDNSNIVVVYSHPVDSQNKQFQLITTQGLEAQFVQSSAIITQNYETVTTSTPIVNAEIVNSQEVWQNEVSQSLDNQNEHVTEDNQITTESAPQETAVKSVLDISDEGIKCQENLINAHLTGLPEIELITEPTKDVPPHIIETNDILVSIKDETTSPQEPNSVTVESCSEPMEQVTVEEILESQPTTNTTIECNVSQEDIVATEPSHTKPIENICESVSEIKEPISNEINDVIENKEPTVTETPTSCEVKENQQESIIRTTPQAPSPTYTPEVSMDVSVELNVPSENIDAIPCDAEVPPPVVVECEKIKDLTSEWSEDEYDIPEPKEVNERITKPLSQPISEDSQEEVEESIENIQQEVDKQLSTIMGNKMQRGINGNDKQSSHISNNDELKKADSNTNTSISDEKLSSLLNDWEDNDSQDLSGEKVENTNVKEDIIQNAVQESESVHKDNQNASKPEDNIKSLVSDWDDDEEDIKN